MGGRTFVGHRRNVVPLSPVLSPRHSPALGWRVDCMCGWSQGSFSRRIEAESAYRDHLLNALPICGRCGESKGLRFMSKSNPRRCKMCARIEMRQWIAANPSSWERSRREFHLRKHYRINIDEYERILAEQEGACAICGQPPKDRRGFRPHIDHCHETGKVRGILCGRCNKGLGALKDDPEIVRRALKYLLGEIGR